MNAAHITDEHAVTMEEAEEVCQGNHITRKSYAERLTVTGPTPSGRMLTVVVAPKGEDMFYPVTARPASPKERHWYKEEKEGVKIR